MNSRAMLSTHHNVQAINNSLSVRTTYYLDSDYQPATYDGGASGNYDSFKAEIDRNATLDTRGFASTNAPGFSIRSSTQDKGII